MKTINQGQDNYVPYKIEDYIGTLGILVTDKDHNILSYNDTAEIIIDVDLSHSKNLENIGNLLPVDALFYENEATVYLETLSCNVRRHYNPMNGTFLYILFGSGFNSILDQMNARLAELEIIFEQSSDGIFITDGEGIILNVNPADEKKCMMSREEMIGKDIRELVANRVFYPSTALKVIETGRTCTITQTTKNGQTVICTGTPIFDNKNKITRVLCNNVDYNELVELKENMEIAERLQRYYQAHSNFEHYRKFIGEGFFVKNKKMMEIIDIIENMLEIDPTVLILGESGVGKSVLAQKIHLNSPYKSNNFIEINCGAIPEHLLESELFGYVKGAFTGANKEGKIGLIELANNGTLFLDEIGDLPIDLQVKLLHVIQNKEIRRVGSTNSIPVNVRIISASNKDLSALVKDGTFREDLYYRLNVVPITIPPLRERKEEIPDLLNIYLSKFNKKYRFNKKFHPSTINCLMDYSWPGNIRELINIVERLMVTSGGDTILPDMLPAEISLNTPINMKYSSSVDLSVGMSLNKAKETLEKNILMEALKTTRNSYEIAKLLDIGQSSVIRKLQKYNLNHFLEGKKAEV